VLQQWDFANRNFMERMHAALSSGARVIALLSNEYLFSEHCEPEWQNAIATDPLNTNARLIVLRVNECTPRGLHRWSYALRGESGYLWLAAILAANVAQRFFGIPG